MMDREPRKRKIMDDNYIEGQVGSKEDKHQPVKPGRGQEEKDQEEDEKEKMEKFFALIRSAKEMRDRMRRSLASLDEVPTTTSSRDQIQADYHQNKIEEGRGSSGMARNPPSFLPEDFLVGSHHHLSGPSKTEERDHDDDQGKKNGIGEGCCSGLDLNLSL